MSKRKKTVDIHVTRRSRRPSSNIHNHYRNNKKPRLTELKEMKLKQNLLIQVY